MKSLTKPNILSCLCALGGVLAFCLRLWFLKTGVDDRGLLVTGHTGNILSFVVTALTVLPVALLTLKVPDVRQSRGKASRPAALGAALGCMGLIAAAWQLLSDGSALLTTVTGVLGICSALCAGFMAFCRLKGLRSPWVSCVIIIFLMLLPIQLYRHWSAQTQLPRYFFQLLGCVCLLLWAFQRAALETGIGSWRAYLLPRHCGIFFCVAAAAGSAQSLFYLTMAAWMLLDGLSVLPEKEERHEAA